MKWRAPDNRPGRDYPAARSIGPTIVAGRPVAARETALSGQANVSELTFEQLLPSSKEPIPVTEDVGLAGTLNVPGALSYSSLLVDVVTVDEPAPVPKYAGP
ncbi:MAG: hypothetical protein QOF23_386 [Solirubrobacterales bacterium]|nr:hypothetical protein [Solirubrobacterales bacterium]